MGRFQQHGRRSARRSKPMDAPGIRGDQQQLGHVVGRGFHPRPNADSDAHADRDSHAHSHPNADTLANSDTDPLSSIQFNITGPGMQTIALAGALVGATYPALKAARKDPIEALAYE